MSEQAAEAPVADDQPQDGPVEQEPDNKGFDESYVKNLRAEAAKYRTEAKAAQRALQQAQQAQMSDAEKAIAEAEQRGASSARTELGREIARLRFDALAGRRNPEFDTAGVLEFFDLSRFLGDDGKPDEKALKQAVERLIPEPASAPSFDGGVRRTANAGPGMNQLLRSALGRE